MFGDWFAGYKMHGALCEKEKLKPPARSERMYEYSVPQNEMPIFGIDFSLPTLARFGEWWLRGRMTLLTDRFRCHPGVVPVVPSVPTRFD